MRSVPASTSPVQSLVAIIAIAYVLVNFFVDILYTVLDPRIRQRASPRVGRMSTTEPLTTVIADAALPQSVLTPEELPAKRKLGLGAWLSIGWLAIVTLSAILAPILADPGPEQDQPQHRPRGSVPRFVPRW